MLAARVHAPGGPEAIVLEELPTPRPGTGELRVRVEAAGVNYIDVYHRTGVYPGALPVRLGLEGAGVVEQLGPSVASLRVGQRVAWSSVAGSYATHVIAPEARLVPIPDGLDARTAAAAMLQGMTAHYLVRSTHRLVAGESCLVHAAAGGVGLLLCQMAKRLGATVLGTVSSEAKAERARAAGADHAIRYDEEDFAAACRRLTSGEGVHVVYDSVGKDTFEKSLDRLRPRGMLVLFGQSSGAVPPFNPAALGAKGSLFLTRPSLMHYTATRDELLERAGDVLGSIARGELRIAVHDALPLADAARAHVMLEGRVTSGKLLLVP
jgi:NADPH2:quinone reductase